MKAKINIINTLIICFSSIYASAQNSPVTESGPSGSITNSVTPPTYIDLGDSSQINLVRKQIPMIPITDANSVGSADPQSVKSFYTYKDGNNQTFQSLETYSSIVDGQAKNLVTIADNRAQQNHFSYLPYSNDYVSNSVPIDISMFSEQKNYYNTNYSNEGYTSFSENIYSSDANSRKTTTYTPGKGDVGQLRGTTVQKTLNTSSSVKIWVTDANGQPVNTGYYTANTVVITTITDPSSKIVKMYTDKDGKLIAKQVSESQSGSTVTYQTTRYIYDDFGNLVYIITPKASDAIGSATTISAAILKNLCFQFKYDEQGRMIQSEKPGEQDFSDIVYDNKDRVVMHRSALEKSLGKWEVIFYDKLDRLMGFSLLTDSQTGAYWQNKIDSQTPADNADIIWYFSGNTGEGTLPSDGTVAGNELMQMTFYDDYANGDDPFNFVYNPMVQQMAFDADLISGNGAETPARSMRVQGLPVGERIKILPGKNVDTSTIGKWTFVNYYYDDKGRLIYKNEADNYNGTQYPHWRNYAYQHDFLNRLILEKQANQNAQAATGTAQTHTELIKNTYEVGTGNLLNTKHKVDGGPWKGLASYNYNDLAQVSSKVIGDGAETQDYAYNIRGQLKSINGYYAAYGDAQNASRSFGEILSYDYGFSQKRYDGKVSGMLWRGTSTTEHAYGYSYDMAGRLTVANYTERYEANATEGPWGNSNTDYTVSSVGYDRNGNITALNQRGMGVVVNDSGPAIAPVNMDQLTYTYEANSNRLMKVADAVSAHTSYDFKDGANTGNDYTYDNSGNLKSDQNKGIDSITYTFFNKPSIIYFANGNKITFSYDASGNKMETLFHNAVAGTNKKMDYVGNFVYQNDTLQYALTPEGRTVIDPVQANVSTEQFFVKDHLGNVRSVMETTPMPLVPYLATYELAAANTESLLFDKVGEIRDDKPGGGGDDTKAGLLNGAVDSLVTGTSLMLQVMAGDEVEMQADNYYDGYNPTGDIPLRVGDVMHSLVTTLAGGISNIGQREGISGSTISSMLQSSANINNLTHVMDSVTDHSKPEAYLTYMQFDQKMNLVQGGTGAYQVTGDGNWTIIGTNGNPVKVLEDGFIIVTIHNRSERPVYFDRLQVLFHRGKLKEETHYYPHGLPMANIGSAAAGMIPNDFRYQTNPFNQDGSLQWMDFSFRQYDPQIGRFLAPDPLALRHEDNSPFMAMSDNPVSFVDPLGLDPDSDTPLPGVIITPDGNYNEPPWGWDNGTGFLGGDPLSFIGGYDPRMQDMSRNTNVGGGTELLLNYMSSYNQSFLNSLTRNNVSFNGNNQNGTNGQSEYANNFKSDDNAARTQSEQTENASEIAEKAKSVVGLGADVEAATLTGAKILMKDGGEVLSAFTGPTTAVGAIIGGGTAIYDMATNPNANYWKDGAQVGLAVVAGVAEFFGVGEIWDYIGLAAGTVSAGMDIYDIVHDN